MSSQETAPSTTESLGGTGPRSLEGGGPLVRGETLGRYVVIDEIGRGGMGAVYTAWDPELGRKIALKLLHHGANRFGDNPIAQEARALAKLRHPNVVSVYDLGETRGHTFLAMEYVDCPTLHHWLASAPSGPERVQCFEQIALGLAAAHRAGIVHGDLKPDNVLVESTPAGAVARVIDFGLARHTRSETPPIGGTPAYMAPELRSEGVGDLKSDQWSLGITGVEMLCGVRWSPPSPFPRGMAGARPYLPILQRAIADEPEQRWPSIDTLVAALARRRRSVRARRWWAALGVVAVTSGAAVGYRVLAESRRRTACAESGDTIDEVWNARARTEVRDGLVATGASYAASTAEKVLPWLDSQAQAWREDRRSACGRIDTDPRWDAATESRALWCFEERRLELASLIHELARADDSVVRKAVGIAARLQPTGPCLDQAWLANRPLPPSGDAQVRLQTVAAEVSRATTLYRAERLTEGLAVAESAHRQAQALGWPPLAARARAVQGALMSRAGSYAEAEAASTAAYFEAGRAGDWDTAADAAYMLAWTVGHLQARPDEGRTWAGHAELSAWRAGDPTRRYEASRLGVLASIDRGQGEYARAARGHLRAIEIWRETLGPDHPTVAVALTNLGSVLEELGEYGDAEDRHLEALAIQRAALGDQHVDVGMIQNNLAVVYARRFEHKRAVEYLLKARSTFESSLGSEHPTVALISSNLAESYLRIGSHDAAEEAAQRAVTGAEAALGPDHPSFAATLGSLAAVHAANGDHQAALPLRKRVLAILETARGPDHKDVAIALTNLANVHTALEDPTAARLLSERALAIREAMYGPDSRVVAKALVNLATIRAYAGDQREAAPLFARALAIVDKTDEVEGSSVAMFASRFAETQLALGEVGQAAALMERALAVVEAGSIAQDPVRLAQILRAAGEVELARSDPRAAIAHLERAITVGGESRGGVRGAPETHFALARALAAAGGNHQRALAHAHIAHDQYAAQGGRPARLDEVRVWIARQEKRSGA